MTNLVFDCLDGRAERYAAAPTIMLQLQIAETTGERIHAIALRCQIRVDVQKRRYSEREAARLLELFGDTARWGDTLKPMHLTTVAIMVPEFSGSTIVDIPISFTYDFEVATAKYFHALDDGEIPLLLMFNGTVFRKTETGFAVEQIPWHKEASYRLPASVWREVMDLYFPNSGWIRINRDTLDALQRFKAERAMTSWDATMDALLAAGERAP